MNRRAKIWLSVVLPGVCVVLVPSTLPHGKDPWPVPDEARKMKNPVVSTEASLAAAKAIFLDSCAQCHGEGGKGDGSEAAMYSVKPANFTDAHMMSEMTDGELFWKISEGRRPMPSFKKQLTEEQRWQLVNFVRNFVPRPTPPAKSAGPAKKPRVHKH